MLTGNFNILESPLLVYGLASVAIGFLLFGAVIVIRSYRESKEDGTAVPIEDIKEIKTGKQLQLSVSSNNATLTKHIVEENLLPSSPTVSATNTAALSFEIDSLKSEIKLLKNQLLENEKISGEKINKLAQENQKLDEALRAEVASKDKIAALEQVNMQVKDVQESAKKAQDSVSRLTEENHSLLKKIEVQQNFVTQIEKQFQLLKVKHEEIINQKISEINELKNSFKDAHVYQLQSQKLTNDLANKIEEIKHLQAALTKKENEQIQIKDLLRDADRKHQAQVDEYVKNINVLKQESAIFKPALRQELEDQLAQLKSELEAVKAQRSDILALKEKLQVEYNQIKGFNVQLMEKEKLLQYELTKNRAQVLGLEKICEDFKVQLDHMHH